MVSSAKKKRGQERKKGRVPSVVFNVSTNDHTAVVQRDHKEHVIKHIRFGGHSVTEALANHTVTNFSLVDSGVLSVVLDFLKSCEHESLYKVVTGARAGADTLAACSGSGRLKHLATPVMWINILSKAVELEKECMLQIAENIGPLVKCMCNDMIRLFFNSGEYWKEGIMPFVQLISDMISKNYYDKEVVTTLLKHEGLLASIIQWGFWGEKNRPDIAKLLTLKGCADIAKLGRSTTTSLITDIDEYLRDDSEDLTEDGKEGLLAFGTTPIVSRGYDSTCMVSFVAGLIRYTKTHDWGEHEVRILELFIHDTDLVDKDVIIEMIDWGMNYANYDDALEVAYLSTSMVIERTSCRPCDTRIAFSIRHGLVEMCLNFINQVKEEYSREDDEDSASLSTYIENIFVNIHYMSLYQKTAKAIRSKRRSIQEKIVSVEEMNNVISYPKCKKLLDMIRGIVDLNGLYCCRCNKSLCRTDVKVCNGCLRMSYCSTDCQREDWMNGHDINCCKTLKHVPLGQFQGRLFPVAVPDNERTAAKLEELEKNQTMIQLKLFLDNAEGILKQAEAMELPLYDCVVTFDLRVRPPTTFFMTHYTVWCNTPELKKWYEETRSKENIMCVYCSSMFYEELLDEGKFPRLIIRRLFPHEWLIKQNK